MIQESAHAPCLRIRMYDEERNVARLLTAAQVRGLVRAVLTLGPAAALVERDQQRSVAVLVRRALRHQWHELRDEVVHRRNAAAVVMTVVDVVRTDEREVWQRAVLQVGPERAALCCEVSDRYVVLAA